LLGQSRGRSGEARGVARGKSKSLVPSRDSQRRTDSSKERKQKKKRGPCFSSLGARKVPPNFVRDRLTGLERGKGACTGDALATSGAKESVTESRSKNRRTGGKVLRQERRCRGKEKSLDGLKRAVSFSQRSKGLQAVERDHLLQGT